MRSNLYFRIAVVCLLAFALVALGGHVAFAAPVPHAGVMMAGLIGPVVAWSPEQLDAATKPGGSPVRAFRGVYYDTQSYVSGATVKLDFYGQINADKSLSNAIGNGGVLPDGYAFVPYTMGVDILLGTSTAATKVGAMDDVAQLVMSGRGFATVKIGTLSMPEIPIRFLHGSGGPFGSVAATLTAPLVFEAATNGVQDGGYDIRGSYVITQNQRASVKIEWPAALTLNTTPLSICHWFNGDWQFPVQ